MFGSPLGNVRISGGFHNAMMLLLSTGRHVRASMVRDLGFTSYYYQILVSFCQHAKQELVALDPHCGCACL